jgi:hypothetical protein
VLLREAHDLCGEIKTPVIPPDAFWPLVRACWTYIDVFAPDIIVARDELEALDRVDSTGSRPTTAAVNTAIAVWLSSADAPSFRFTPTRWDGPAPARSTWTVWRWSPRLGYAKRTSTARTAPDGERCFVMRSAVAFKRDTDLRRQDQPSLTGQTEQTADGSLGSTGS